SCPSKNRPDGGVPCAVSTKIVGLDVCASLISGVFPPSARHASCSNHRRRPPTMGVRVVLADDHAVVRRGVKLLLEMEGFEVVGEAADGLEAVRVVKELAPEIAVLDRAMPLLNGIDAAREIRVVSPSTKLILLTMDTDERHHLEALRAGFRGC